MTDNLPALGEFLGTTLMFRGLSPNELEAIARIAKVQKYNKGDVIFSQGSEATGFFAIETGRVKVYKLGLDGKEQILHVFGKREHFAEVPALDGKCFPASAAAIDAVKLVFFPRVAFLDLLQQQPTLAVNMLMSFTRHLRRFSNLVEELSLKEVPERLAAYLLNLSDRTNNPQILELDLTKTQLAAFLGTIPATLSRVFYKLSAEGIIAIDGSKIQILDRERLRLLGARD